MGGVGVEGWFGRRLSVPCLHLQFRIFPQKVEDEAVYKLTMSLDLLLSGQVL